MKKRINGVLCDTTTAEKIGEYATGSGASALTESLYLMKSGKYFIYSEGGADSRCAVREPSGKLIPGETLEVISDAAADNWAQEHYGESLDELLSKVRKQWTTIKIPVGLKAQLDELRLKTGETMSDILEKSVGLYVSGL